MTTVSVCIPSIPPRAGMLATALGTVCAQARIPDAVLVAVDHDRQGPAAMRNRLIAQATTDWIAFLDDDDELGPEHLQACLDCAEETGADVVYPWFVVVGGTDPFPQHFGRPWDPDDPVQTTITMLVRRDWLVKVGGFADTLNGDTDAEGNRVGEDFDLILRLNAAGARIVHLPRRTWFWNHWAGNTSGRTDRW